MRVQMVKLVSRKDGKVTEFSKKHWLKELKKEPRLSNHFDVSEFMKEFQSFKFIAWIHPKRGGDDYQVEIDQVGDSLEDAKKSLEQYLSKISAVTNDYQEVK